MTTLHEVIAMPDGSWVVKFGSFVDGDIVMSQNKEIFKYSSKVDYTTYHSGQLTKVILTINRKEPLEGVPNIKTDVYESSKQIIARGFLAQVFKNGKAFITIDSTADDSEANKIGEKIAVFLNGGGFTEEQMREALCELAVVPANKQGDKSVHDDIINGFKKSTMKGQHQRGCGLILVCRPMSFNRLVYQRLHKCLNGGFVNFFP